VRVAWYDERSPGEEQTLAGRSPRRCALQPSSTTAGVPKLRRGRRRLRVRQLLGWGVHLYTALGLVAAGGIAVALLHPSPESFRISFLLMAAAILIDATDGTLARLVRVKEVLPGFDGARLDDLIDFQTYTSLPLLLLYQAHILPPGQEAWLLAPLLASAYGFSQVSAKTADGYFLGFPSYWNLVAFYLYLFQPPAGWTIALLLVFSLLTFVPAVYLYPTRRGGKLNRLTNWLGAVWGLLLVWLLYRLPSETTNGQYADEWTRLLGVVSLAYPIYYLAASWGISLNRRMRSAEQRRLHGQSGAEPERQTRPGPQPIQDE
jgi:phosphatidylcholine synthase